MLLLLHSVHYVPSSGVSVKYTVSLFAFSSEEAVWESRILIVSLIWA